MIPNLFCIGAPKSGTTSLFDILKEHPQVFLPKFKEPRFFDDDDKWTQGKDWYLSEYFNDYCEQKVVGDFTPTYLYNKNVPARIKQLCKNDVKFIILLRNPIDRAYSHYLHTVRKGQENLSFSDAIKKEKLRLDNCEDFISKNNFSYIEYGLYSKYLKDFFTEFGQSSFHVLLFDDFTKKPKESVLSILEFLEINVNSNINFNQQSNQASKQRFKNIKNLIKRNILIRKFGKMIFRSELPRQRIRNYIEEYGNKPFEKDEISTELRKEIYHNHFQNEIEALENLLGINLNDWKPY